MNFKIKESRLYANELMIADEDGRYLASIRINTDMPPDEVAVLEAKLRAVLQEGWRRSSDGAAAVALGVYWQPIHTAPTGGEKIQLLSKYGVAVYGSYHGDDHGFWTHWAPLPRRPK